MEQLIFYGTAAWILMLLRCPVWVWMSIDGTAYNVFPVMYQVPCQQRPKSPSPISVGGSTSWFDWGGSEAYEPRIAMSVDPDVNGCWARLIYLFEQGAQPTSKSIPKWHTSH